MKQNQIATKTDLIELEEVLKSDIKQLREDTKSDLNQLREDTRSDINQLRENTRSDIKELWEATKSELITLESRIREVRDDLEILEEKSDVIQEDINTMKDDIAKVLVFLYEHFPIQQHQVRENTDRIEAHEVRITKVEGNMELIMN